MAAVCSLSPAACFGQHTVVQDAGGGRKVELVYNASDQVAETRIVAQAGRLQERVEYEYRSGFLVPQQTTTSYWSDGRAVRSVTRVGYDENGNFTGEWIALSSPAGGQTGGTQLTHDPFTGIYRCSHWDPVGQDYQPGECPASEESAAAPEKAKELTYDEAMKLLELARQARREEQKAQRMERKSSVQPPIRTVMKMKQIGVILPAHLRAGERVSGSLVEDPKKYDGRPDLRLVRMDLPLESQGDATSLRGWTFEVAGEDPQRADGPVTFTVPQASELSVTLRQAGNPAHAVSRLVSAAPAAEQRPPQKPPTSPAFEAPALCLKGGLCVVRGPFNGDSSKTLVAFGRWPAPIVAETKDPAYISVPTGIPTGLTRLIVVEGSQLAALPVDVAGLSSLPNQQNLLQGQTVLVHAILSGPVELPDEQWRAGNFPPGTSVDRARDLVPGFEPPRAGGEGVILLVIGNATPEGVSLRGSKNQTFVFKLTRDSFKNGDFKYQFVVEAAKSASFAPRGSIMPFLRCVRGQEFASRPGIPEK